MRIDAHNTRGVFNTDTQNWRITFGMADWPTLLVCGCRDVPGDRAGARYGRLLGGKVRHYRPLLVVLIRYLQEAKG